MSNIKVDKASIASFLEGHNPMKYVVAIECNQMSDEASLVINDPNIGKSIVKKKYKSFIWLTQRVGQEVYGGNKLKIREAMTRFGVKFRALQTKDSIGFEPERMRDGYKFIAECSGSYQQLLNFFKLGGINPLQRGDDNFPERMNWSKEFVTCKPVEQFMIQTGIRLFKGMDDYDDLHRLQFDLETTGLLPRSSRIFQVGVRDNKKFTNDKGEEIDFELILETKGENSKEMRESERKNIMLFAHILETRRPDVITGYNSEDFDWPFIEERCRILSLDFGSIFKGLNGSAIKRQKSRLKLGSDSFDYQQAYLWGTNILDISHSVRRAMAINSEIKSWSLKWITKYSEVEKPNRVYVPGDMIHTIWNDTEGIYYFNNVDGDWFKFEDENKEHYERISDDNYSRVTGAYIVQRYLKDDLWETEVIDGIYNQASFLMAKIIPTTFMRSSTMGTAGIWQLIMQAWSYENNLAVPLGQGQQTFVGGLSRLCEVGFRRNVIKLDYAALYPNVEITHDIFPRHDISGVMKGLLVYIAETRDEYKALKGKYEKLAEDAKTKIGYLDPFKDAEEILKLSEEYRECSFLASNYDKKQLPIKILANSFFGSFGAPHVFNWGDIDCAEETTCRGRQYLRLMVKHFLGYGFVALVADTDGLNFAIPDDIESVTYIPNGTHRFTEKYKDVELSGTAAVVAEFNELYMIGRMGLDIDDICTSTINFSRKNYANDILKKGKSKVKLVGNTIKSNKMPKYIEEFLNEGIRYLLDDEGDKFVDLYYKTVDNVVNYNIPLSKIASKSRVRATIEGYKEKCKTKNKAGNPMPRQAHMELAIRNDLTVNIGDTIYYINTGNKKSDGDLKSIKNADGSVDVQLTCKLLTNAEVENNPNATTDEYNAKKYLDMLNKRIAKIMVCFNPDVRGKIIIEYEKSKEIFTVNENGRKVFEEILQERSYFTREDLKLTNGIPLNEIDQDDVEVDLLLIEDREVEFWKRVGKIPNNVTNEFWEQFLVDYEERRRLEDIYYNFKYREDLLKFSFNFTSDMIEEIKRGVPPELLTKKFNFIDGNILFGKYTLCKLEDLLVIEPLVQSIEEWISYNPKKKAKQWIDKYGDSINFNEYYLKGFKEIYSPEEIKYVPRVYKDYDELYEKDDAE